MCSALNSSTFTRGGVSGEAAATRSKLRTRRFDLGVLVVCTLIPSMATAQTGWVRQLVGTTWVDLDRNPDTLRISTGGGELYQLRANGSILRYTGTPCDAYGCPGWEVVDRNPDTIEIAADGDPDPVSRMWKELYQRRTDGSLWRFTGEPCTESSCDGWTLEAIGVNHLTFVNGELLVMVTPSSPYYWYHNHGDAMYCAPPGFLPYVTDVNIDQNYEDYFYGQAGCVVQTTVLGSDPLILTHTGAIFFLTYQWEPWYHGQPQYRMIDNNGATVQITSAGNDSLGVYQLHSDGSIWQWNGEDFCGPLWNYEQTCPGWRMVDNKPGTVRIVSVWGALYKIATDGLWRYTGTPCTGTVCPGWEQLTSANGLSRIAADGDRLYLLGRPILPLNRSVLQCDECR
jgi:hypothetical protein